MSNVLIQSGIKDLKISHIPEEYKPRLTNFNQYLIAGALKTWNGEDNNLEKAQNAFNHRALMNMKAAQGNWDEKLEAK